MRNVSEKIRGQKMRKPINTILNLIRIRDLFKIVGSVLNWYTVLFSKLTYAYYACISLELC